MKRLLPCFFFLLIGSAYFAKTGSHEGTMEYPAAQILKKDSLHLPDVKLYPNPARNKVTLEVNGFLPGMLTVKIIDDKGRLMKAYDRLLINGAEEVPVFLSLPSGIYYIVVVQKSRYIKKRLSIL